MNHCDGHGHPNRCTFSRPKTAAACCSPTSRTIVLVAFVMAATCLMTRPADALPQTDDDGGGQIFPHAGGSCKCISFLDCKDSDVINIPGGGENTNPCPSGYQCCNLPTLNNDVSSCGYRHNMNLNIKERITSSGTEAMYGEYPWMVAIYEQKAYMCGGSLIHPQVVLTTAHSVYRKDPKQLEVFAGDWDLSNENEPNPVQNARPSKIIIHEKYIGGGLFYNDIALVFITPPFILSKNVAILCLPPQGFVLQNQRCFATGWGKNITSTDKDASSLTTLKRLELPIVPRNICQAKLRQDGNDPHFDLHDSFLCAGGEIGKDTCKGDGGSPLMCPTPNDPNQFLQAGIVSWGYNCGTETPSVYTDVSKFRIWIDRQITDLNLGTHFYETNLRSKTEIKTPIAFH